MVARTQTSTSVSTGMQISINYMFRIFLFFILTQAPLYPNQPDADVYVSKYIPTGNVSENFKIPHGLERAVDFWIDVYSKYDVDHIIVHDTDYYVIYDVIDVSDVSNVDEFSDEIKNEIIESRVDVVKNRYRAELKEINDRLNFKQELSGPINDLYNKFENISDNKKFLEASRPGRMRIQKGQASNFKKGIYYSQLYMGQMEKIFLDKKLPLELARLPYVESYFNPVAVSHKNATGMWQFMKGTGTEYMSVSGTYDERKDPFSSTKAAAELLNQSYEFLWHNWPLAITAYNHGRFGMKKASIVTRSKDLVEIVKKYEGGSFGFASKNFYAEFLAALFIDLNKGRFFEGIEGVKLFNSGVVELIKPLKISQIELLLDVDKNEIRSYNPAISGSAFERDDTIPRGARIRIPSQMVKKLLSKTENIRGITNYVKAI